MITLNDEEGEWAIRVPCTIFREDLKRRIEYESGRQLDGFWYACVVVGDERLDRTYQGDLVRFG
jgi:hypothetical protein